MPSSSTFQGEKWFSGVKGVPYRAVTPSLITETTAKRNAMGNSRRYVTSCACAAARSAFSDDAFFNSISATGTPFR